MAREVGVEGRLGGQANVPGAAGTWKDLTGNVNLLRRQPDHAGARHRRGGDRRDQGRPDPLRSQVDARGEVAELKDNINTMIGNLRLTTPTVNTEQDWLKTNLAKFTNMLQGQRDLVTVGRLLLTELAPLVNAQLGVIYQIGQRRRRTQLQPALGLCRRRRRARYPHGRRSSARGWSASARSTSADRAGLGHAGRRRADRLGAAARSSRRNIVVLPVLFENQVKAVIELASLDDVHARSQTTFLEQLTDIDRHRAQHASRPRCRPKAC